MRLFIFTVILICLTTSITFARAHISGQLSQNDLQKITANNSFWTINKLDRFFFSANGTFSQQLNDDHENYENGKILEGSYSIENKNLCLKYNENQGQDKFCFAVYSPNLKDTDFFQQYDDTFQLHRVLPNQSINPKPSFVWNKWAHNSYIFSPDYAPLIKNTFDKVKNIIRLKKLPENGSINPSNLTDVGKDFYDEVVGKILFLGGHVEYIGANGHFFTTTEDAIVKFKDTNKFLHDRHFGKWVIQDNIFCAQYFEDNKMFCELLMPRGKGLVRPYDGLLGFHHNGFSRVYNELGFKRMQPAEAPHSEFFKKIENHFLELDKKEKSSE